MAICTLSGALSKAALLFLCEPKGFDQVLMLFKLMMSVFMFNNGLVIWSALFSYRCSINKIMRLAQWTSLVG